MAIAPQKPGMKEGLKKTRVVAGEKEATNQTGRKSAYL
jgi:hypothetical protein